MNIPRLVGVVVVVLVAAVLWLLFGQIAYHHHGDWNVIDKGLAWTMPFLGLLSALLGLLGLARPIVVRGLSWDAAAVGPPAAGVLAGAVLLGIGSWGAPLALTGLVVGGGTLRYLAGKHRPDADDAT